MGFGCVCGIISLRISKEIVNYMIRAKKYFSMNLALYAEIKPSIGYMLTATFIVKYLLDHEIYTIICQQFLARNKLGDVPQIAFLTSETKAKLECVASP